MKLQASDLVTLAKSVELFVKSTGVMHNADITVEITNEEPPHPRAVQYVRVSLTAGQFRRFASEASVCLAIDRLHQQMYEECKNIKHKLSEERRALRESMEELDRKLQRYRGISPDWEDE